MGDWLKDREHLLRLALLFAVGFTVFLIARAVLIPEGFGEYGHYRAGAIDDNRARPVKFAGQVACADCHGDVLETKAAGKHGTVRCEACHGALAAHAEDPASVVPEKPKAEVLCPVCHQKNVARPATFPQVDPKEHSGGESCSECHQPHSPGF